MSRLNQFFEQNPDEELTYADAAVKFGISERSVMSRIGEAIREGEPLKIVRVIRRAA
ncbi:MAG: hypothetical protein H0W48_00095 [Methylibium sp.]|nr:hypothetical protein [Methylibium sp.]